MIYHVFSDGAIFPSKIDFVIYFIKVRSNDNPDVQELKNKSLKELQFLYRRLVKVGDNVSRFCFSKKEANQVSDYVTKTGYFPL